MIGLLAMPVAKTSCLGLSMMSLPSRSTTTVHSLALSSYDALLQLGRAPIIELHDLGVHFQPVADLVLRREYRPVLRERQIRHMVVPDRIMQAERLVALAPAVAGPLVLLHDDGRHAELLQARAKPDAALAAADDQAIGLARMTELGGFLPRAPPSNSCADLRACPACRAAARSLAAPHGLSTRSSSSATSRRAVLQRGCGQSRGQHWSRR